MTTPTTADRATITRTELQMLDAEALCQRCVAPVIVRMRGQPLAARIEVYATISPGQRALLGFWLVYNYGRNGWKEFRTSLQHVIPYAGFWPALEAAARHFELEALADLVAKMAELESRPRAERAAASAEIDRELAQLRTLALAHVVQILRTSPAEYMELVLLCYESRATPAAPTAGAQ